MREYSSDPIFSSSAKALEHWYEQHKRFMPWRETKAPYNIWLSEIILQQTRVEQGLPYYISFLENFPTVHDLAQAEEESVLRTWQGLGYYNRARNLHKTSKTVVAEFNGVFPTDYATLLSLPGIGPYTAAAIASICAEEEVPVVDGNVQRLIARHFLVEEEVDSSAGTRLVRSIAQSWIQGRLPSRFNQAMMELGALVCSPRSPSCDTCPIAETCMALRTNKVESLPLKKSKKAPIERHLIFHVHLSNENTWLVKRGLNGIWAGLYEWPFTECSAEEKTNLLQTDFKGHKTVDLLHILSHQRIHALFIIHMKAPSVIDPSYFKVKWMELDELPMSRLMTRFLEVFPKP